MNKISILGHLHDPTDGGFFRFSHFSPGFPGRALWVPGVQTEKIGENGGKWAATDDWEEPKMDLEGEVGHEVELEEVPGAEMIDDPVRMYLREIGRVGLLTAKEERTLARKLENSRYIERIEKDFQEQTGRPPRSR